MHKYPWMKKGIDDISLEELKGDGDGKELIILALRSMPYKEYLKTSHWSRIREQKIKERPLCEYCRKRTAKEIHHVTYENRGCEDMDDLRSMCSDCHRKLHRHWSYNDEPGEMFEVASFTFP